MYPNSSNNENPQRPAVPTDGNFRPAIFGVDVADGVTPVVPEVNPDTGGMLVQEVGAGDPLAGSGVKYKIKNISPDNDPEIATYKYFGYIEVGGSRWCIMRKTLATKLFEYDYGESGYSTAWTNKNSGDYL